MTYKNCVIHISFLTAICLLSSCASITQRDIEDAEFPFEILSDRAVEDLVVDPELVKQFGIRNLEIENCLDQSQCFLTKYVFNDCGKIEFCYPPMVETWWHYEYDEDCRLTSATGIHHVRYEYTYLPNDSVQQDIFDVSSDTIDVLSARCKFKHMEQLNHSKPDTIGNLVFPCGSEFVGQHVVLTHNYANGLIESVQYFVTSHVVVVEERYHYSGANGVEFEFTK